MSACPTCGHAAPPVRTCALKGCEKPARPKGKWCSDAHRTEAWKARVRYRSRGRENGAETAQRRRKGGPRGVDLPWRRANAVVADGLLQLDRLPATPAEAAEVAERLLLPAVGDRQRPRLDAPAVGIVGQGGASHRADLAKRIANAHNALRAAMADGGVLAFSPEGMAVRPLPGDEQYGLEIERLPFPIRDRDVTAGEVERWLAGHREHQAEAYERREAERAEAHARREMREGEQARHYGMVTGAANCESCGAFKSKPSAVCSLCGDDPVSHHGDARDFDRAHGRAA